MPRKLEAGLHGRYLMSSDLITSTMKSEPAAPPVPRGAVCGVPPSAAAVWAFGPPAGGLRSGAIASGPVAANAPGAAVVAAAPATATPDRNLRRLAFGRSDELCRRAMSFLPMAPVRSLASGGGLVILAPYLA